MKLLKKTKVKFEAFPAYLYEISGALKGYKTSNVIEHLGYRNTRVPNCITGQFFIGNLSETFIKNDRKWACLQSKHSSLDLDILEIVMVDITDIKKI